MTPTSWWAHLCVVWTCAPRLSVGCVDDAIEDGKVIQGHFQELVIKSQCLAHFDLCSLCLSVSVPLAGPPHWGLSLCVMSCYLETPTWPSNEGEKQTQRKSCLPPKLNPAKTPEEAQVLSAADPASGETTAPTS